MHDARNLVANKQTQPLNKRRNAQKMQRSICDWHSGRLVWQQHRCLLECHHGLQHLGQRRAWCQFGAIHCRLSSSPLSSSTSGASSEPYLILTMMVRMWRIFYGDNLWVGLHLWRQLHQTSHSPQWRAIGRKLVISYCDHVDDNNYNNYMKVGVRIGRCQCPLLWPGLAHAGRFILPLLLFIMMITIFL